MIGIDPEGKLAHNLHDPTGFFDQATGAYPVGDALYLGSYTDRSIACITRPGAAPEADPCDPWVESPEEVAVASFASAATAAPDAGRIEEVLR